MLLSGRRGRLRPKKEVWIGIELTPTQARRLRGGAGPLTTTDGSTACPAQLSWPATRPRAWPVQLDELRGSGGAGAPITGSCSDARATRARAPPANYAHPAVVPVGRRAAGEQARDAIGGRRLAGAQAEVVRSRKGGKPMSCSTAVRTRTSPTAGSTTAGVIATASPRSTRLATGRRRGRARCRPLAAPAAA